MNGSNSGAAGGSGDLVGTGGVGVGMEDWLGLGGLEWGWRIHLQP